MPSDAGNYDFEVDPSNRNSTYGLIFGRVPDGSAVLDIGCASGNLAVALERLRGCRVVGIDIDPDAVAAARAKGIRAHLADLTRRPAAAIVGGRTFDVIILADVLEHLANPAQVLASVGALLNPGDTVLCSFPNITHVDVQMMLAQDQWRTQPTGILDETHLRFFTRASFADLAVRCGFDVAAVERVLLPPLGTEVLDYGARLALDSKERQALVAISQRGNANSEVYQYVFELHQAPALTRPEAAAPSDPERGETPLAGAEEGRLDVIVRTVEGRLNYLKDALYSLVGLTYPKVRAIVCIDRSSADYATAVQDLADRLKGLLDVLVTVVPPHGAERGRPLNWGLDQASGEFISFLDDDDVYYPSFGDRLIGCLRDHPEVTVAYGIGQVVRGDATPWGFRALTHVKRYDEPFDRAHLFLENYIPINTMVLGRRAVATAGLRFDETLEIYEDWAFLRELAARFDFRFVDSVISEYRLRTDGSNAVPEGSEERWARVGSQLRERYASQPVRVRAQELADLAERARGCESKLTRAQAELATLRANLEEFRHLNQRLLASKSWKVTRPLRRVMRSALPEDPGTGTG
ncbi:MAG: methyltransferase domain-containing protein [Candidatus Dormibacteria bacterium]